MKKVELSHDIKIFLTAGIAGYVAGAYGFAALVIAVIIVVVIVNARRTGK